nr:hypothetical protein [Tanacetum cinerariifolium]
MTTLAEYIIVARAENRPSMLEKSMGNYAVSQPRAVKCYNYQGEEHMIEDLNAYDSDCDDISLAKLILMENLSSCDSNILSEVPYSDTYPNDMINPDVHEMPYFEQTHIIDFPNNEINSDRNIISYSQYLQEQDTDDEETLILGEASQSKMFDKQNDPISIKQIIKISPIDYSKLNNLKEDFDTPIRIEAPRELSKVSLVNESLKKLKYHLVSFDKVVKKKITYDAITADEITEVKNVFNQMEAAIDQCSANKNDFEIQIKQLRIDNDQLLNKIMSQEIVHIVVNFVDVLDVSMLSVDKCNKCLVLETELFKRKDLIE